MVSQTVDKRPAAKVLDTASCSSGSRTSLASNVVDSSLVKDGYGSQGGHVFEDDKKAEYWRKIYETAKYESLHRFDPKFKWTAAEEKKVLRKVCCPPPRRNNTC